MRKLRNSIPFFLLLFTFAARAQNTEVILNYINTYKELAIQEMQRTGVPAAIKLAQGIHETTAGTSDLVQKSNNHFGIKCKDTWTGASVFHDDDSRGECFRKYPSAIDSYRDHSDFLKSSDRYSFLFKLEPTDYKDWAYGLKRAGYATNPRYPQIIIGLIEDYHLQDYTLMALGKMAAPENAIVKTTIENGQRQTGPSFVIKQEETIKQPEKIIDRPSYPEGTEFRINDTRVIYAKKGTSFLAIAQEYNVPLARLFEFNDMSQSETVNKDQLIYLQRKRKTGSNEFHTMQAGETLYDIAQLEAIRLETFLSEEAIQQRVKELATSINKDYAGKRPLFIAILNGSFMFASDLFKHLTVEAELCFIKIASYKGMKSSGKVITSIGLEEDLFKKDVVIVEDIVDTGKTLHRFLPKLIHQQPKSLKIVTLLHKPEATEYPLTLDYIGFDIPNKFVVGYGLDYDGLGRNFKEIYQLV